MYVPKNPHGFANQNINIGIKFFCYGLWLEACINPPYDVLLDVIFMFTARGKFHLEWCRRLKREAHRSFPYSAEVRMHVTLHTVRVFTQSNNFTYNKQ